MKFFLPSASSGSFSSHLALILRACPGLKQEHSCQRLSPGIAWIIRENFLPPVPSDYDYNKSRDAVCSSTLALLPPLISLPGSQSSEIGQRSQLQAKGVRKVKCPHSWPGCAAPFTSSAKMKWLCRALWPRMLCHAASHHPCNAVILGWQSILPSWDQGWEYLWGEPLSNQSCGESRDRGMKAGLERIAGARNKIFD